MCVYERQVLSQLTTLTVQKTFIVDYTIVKLQPDLEPNLNEREQT